jgi:cytochrome c oxidase assembly protein subunit 15
MVLGALVRAHGAGLACPDWPLCFGEVVPRFDLKVAFEWTHRVVAGSLSLVFLGLVGLTWRRPATFASVRGLLVAAALLLAVQILLGALTVWKLLASWTVTSHLVTANLFAITVLLVALRIRERAQGAPAAAAAPRAARAWAAAAALLLGAQIVLGGLVSSSFAGMACPEWPTCLDGEWFPRIGGLVPLHLMHRTNGYLVVAGLLGLALAARRTRAATPAGVAAVLGLAQVAVGVANVLWGIPVEVTALHSALAAALVLALTVTVHRLGARPA